MDTLSILSKNMSEMKQLFAAKMSSFEEALGNCGQSQETTVLASEYNSFKKSIWNAVTGLSSQLELVLYSLDDFEMRSRSNIFLLHGLAEENNEDIYAAIQSILTSKLQLSLSSSAVSCCWRMSKVLREDKPRPILIRCSDSHIRNQIWAVKKHLKGSGLTLSEFLIAPRHAVFVEARKALGIKGCWTSDGKIVVVTRTGSRRKITTMEELRAIVADYEAAKAGEVPKAGMSKAVSATKAGEVPKAGTFKAASVISPAKKCATTSKDISDPSLAKIRSARLQEKAAKK